MAEGQGNRVKQEKQKDVRMTNILAAKAVAEAIRTSLGPRGMDKMIKDAQGEVTITNDGATIMSKIDVVHPAAKMLVELSKAQDIEAGDGTTTVVIIAGALLSQAQYLLDKGIHPSVIVDNYQKAADKAVEILEEISIKLELNDQEALVRAAATSLSSKVICQHSQQLAPLAVRAVLAITDISQDTNVDVKNIKINKKLGGTLEDSEMIDGLVFTDNKISHQAGGPSKIVNPKIGIIQFCLSQPKTDIENNVTISDYAAMDRLLREERKYILELCKKIAATGCNMLLIQKSIVKDATNDLSLHYLAKAKIMVIKDIDREPLQFYAKTLGAQPVAHIDYFTPEKLGKAALVEEVHQGGEGKYIKITGIQANQQKTVSILLRGTSSLILDEAERSLHDALCVVRSLIKKRALLPGGGAPEMEVSQKLEQLAHQQCKGLQQVVWRAFAEALEVIPYTLAENAGLDPITIVTELRNKHAQGDKFAGINVRQGIISDIVQENVVQPLLVTTSAITLATECVRMILKIDDVLQVVSIMD